MREVFFIDLTWHLKLSSVKCIAFLAVIYYVFGAKLFHVMEKVTYLIH